MTNRSLLIGCLATMSLVAAGAAQTATPQQQPPRATPATPATTPAPAPAQTAAAPAPGTQVIKTAVDERAALDRYCVSCHNEKAKAAMDSARKLQLDTLDPANVIKDGAKWELVVRKLRAGMMPPAGVRRPDAPVYDSMISYLEGELDKNTEVHMPPPGLHRLNRTEYANM